MSYSISFKVKVEGVNQHVVVGNCCANTTYNVREMIIATTGLPWVAEGTLGTCSEIVPKIARAWVELEMHPEKYKYLESPNDWGTIGSTIQFFLDIISAWVSFSAESPELATVALFWIE